MSRPVESSTGPTKAVSGEPPGVKRANPGDHLTPPRPAESEFQTQFTPGGAPTAPVKLGAKEYDADLWDSPLVRTLKRSITGWTVPSPETGQTLSEVLKADDPRLVSTDQRPGREAWRAALQQLVVSAGAKQAKPTAFFLAGPMGVGKIAISNKLYDDGVLPQAVVKADADYLHNLVPEQAELTTLGDGRGANVVHEEASTIARLSYEQALVEKRDVVHNTMLGSAPQLQRLQNAKSAGFKRVVLAIVSPLEVARARAGANGAFVPEDVLTSSHRDFAKNFDEVVKGSDELVLLLNHGSKLEVIAQGKSGELTVKNPAAYAQFRAQKDQ